MSTVRVCVPAKYGASYEFQPDGSVTGVFAGTMKDITSFLERGSNTSFTFRSENDDIGQLIDEKTGAYDGCIGLIQKNQSDMMFQVANYPLPAAKVYQGQIVTDSVIQFVGIYTSRQEGEAVQLESCFNSFEHILWLLCILVSIVATMALALRRWLVSRRLILRSRHDVTHLLRPSRSIFYQVTTHMISQGGLQFNKGVFGKLITFSLSIFALLVLFYFCSFIKTELVAVRPPKTLRSYKDLIDNKVGLGVYEGMGSESSFAGGAPRSEERRLWDLTRAKYPNGENVIKAEPAKAPRTLERIMTKQLVLVIDSIWTPFLLRFCCRFLVDKDRIAIYNDMGLVQLKPKTIFPLVGEDKKARLTLKNFILNQSTRSGMINLRRALTCMRETGILPGMLKAVEYLDVLGKVMNLPDRITSAGLIEECARNIVYAPGIVVDGIRLKNMKNVFVIYFAFLFVASIILVAENVLGMKKHRIISHTDE